MGVQDGLSTIFYYPVSSVFDLAKKAGTEAMKLSGVIKSPTQEIKLPSNLQNLDVTTLVHRGSPYVRIAAVSGATALILGAYGAHTLPFKEGYKERKSIYDTANRYHFYSSLALLGVPMCCFPKTAASFMTVGMILFCGTCYFRAFTGNPKLNKLTPIGGACLIFGWLCMVL